MRICYFGSAKSIHLIRWAQYFRAQGDDVHLITLHPPAYDLDGVTIHYVESKLSRYMDAAFLANKNHIQGLLGRIQPDLLHAHFLVNYGFYGAALGFRPLVISAWGSDVLIHPQRSLRLRLMARYAAEKADLVLSESNSATKALIQVMGTPPEKIRTFPWGIDTTFFLRHDEIVKVEKFRQSLGIARDTKVVLSPRSMAPTYDIPAILRAIPQVANEMPNTIFIMLRGFGNPRYEEDMKALASDLRIMDRVRFVGATLSPEEMRILFNSSDIMVSVPRTDSASVALVEGMLCGLIPIVSDLETNRDVIRDGENGFIVPVGNSMILGERINYVLKDLEYCKEKFVPINKDYVLNHRSWKVFARNMEAVYREILKVINTDGQEQQDIVQG